MTQATHSVIQTLLTLTISMLSIMLMAPLSLNVASIFAASLLFVSFIAPAILVRAQKFKKCVTSASGSLTKIPPAHLVFILSYIVKSGVLGMWLHRR